LTARQPLGTTREVAEYLQKPVRTLDQWAYLGIGPKYARVGRERRYKWSDVDAWLEAQYRGVA
jgi:excisionase family DNA binding protein